MARKRKQSRPTGGNGDAPPGHKVEPVRPRTENQRQYLAALRSAPVTFGLGPAGTGKSFIATAVACEMLLAGHVERLILTRPAVEAGESLGFLPGELQAKYEPYIAPLRAILEARLGKGPLEYLIKAQRILPMPLAYMRGITFGRDFVILDEAQNTTPAQMKLFLTRVGEHTRVAVDGDTEQADLTGLSGLSDAVGRVRDVSGVRVVRFDEKDVVRSTLVAEFIRAYRTRQP